MNINETNFVNRVVTINSVKKYLEELNGKFFTVKFVKKDGTERVLNGRTGVIKHLRGGESKNHNPDHVIVYDVHAKGYRTVNLENVLEIHSQHNKFVF